MIAANKMAPSFRLSPSAHEWVNLWRYSIDSLGVLALRLFTPLFPMNGVVPWIVSIYTVAAWVTILTVRPQHLPEFSTTRPKRKKAWKTALFTIPLFLFVCLIGAWALGTSPFSQGFHPWLLPSLLMPAFSDELLFRNLLQPQLRRFGLPRAAAILLQSLLFALPFSLVSHSVTITLTAVLLGLHNGWLSSRTRTFWPGFVTSFFWRVLFLM